MYFLLTDRFFLLSNDFTLLAREYVTFLPDTSALLLPFYLDCDAVVPFLSSFSSWLTFSRRYCIYDSYLRCKSTSICLIFSWLVLRSTSSCLKMFVLRYWAIRLDWWPYSEQDLSFCFSWVDFRVWVRCIFRWFLNLSIIVSASKVLNLRL